MTHVAALRPIDAKTYVPHDLHGVARAWGESNCYIDVWIEVLHTLGCDPHACLGFVLALDWEGDQFTFFKPPHEDLYALYGVDVQELTVYKPLALNALEQLRDGKLVLAEADSFFLPDTLGTDYRTKHTKTTIAIQEIDLETRELGYFHNTSYHTLSGADFAELFRVDALADPAFMPLYAEFIRTARVKRLEKAQLRALSTTLMNKHFERRPTSNPIARFAPAFMKQVEGLKSEGLAAYHAYAFATIRQLGAAFELAAVMLRWHDHGGERGVADAAASFDAISTTCKSLILKAARAVGTKKDVDLGAMLADLETHWARGMDSLAKHYGA